MSHRSIRISFPELNISAIAILLDEQAPATCQAIWDQLATPLDMKGHHAMWTGPEVSLQVPPDQAVPGLAAPPPENLTIYPQPGDLIYAYVPPRAWGGLSTPVFDIGIFYGPHGRMFFPIGWMPGNHFGRLEGDWSALRDACKLTRTKGTQLLRFERNL